MEFTHIPNTTSEQRIRAWSIEQAIASLSPKESTMPADRVVLRAKKIEEYVRGSDD